MSVTLNPEAPEFLPANIESSIESGLTSMSRTVRLSNSLPIGIAYKKYEVLPDFNTVTEKFNQNVVYQLNSIFVTELPSFSLREHDIEYNSERLIIANDSILDRINNNIDCLNKGIQPSNPNDFYNPIITTIQVGSTTFTGGKNIILPQLLFKDKVDNSTSLWVPKIFDKPNNIKPLALQIHYNEHGEAIGYEHPYETELAQFYPRPEWLTAELEEMPIPPPVEETMLTFVASEGQLNELMKHLETVEELGVDLEHHNYRSYQGFTCLIQITTVAGDFIVDALALREHLYKLNEVFTNPRQLKIFHGANMDVQWLQRDFGVYVVGMFDTHQAARELNMTRKSLAALLKRYCDLDIDKTYQLADWRLRPLTKEMIHYARADTHYLLYIYRRLKADLLEVGGGSSQRLLAVFEASRQVCCLTYNKQVLKEDSHMSLYYRNKKQFNSRQMAALRSLYRWRHDQARTLDESTMYLLPNHMLLALAENLPRDVQGVSSLCSPTPPFVKQNLYTIHRMLLSCRELPLETELVTAGVQVACLELPAPEYNVHDVYENDEGAESQKDAQDCAEKMETQTQTQTQTQTNSGVIIITNNVNMETSDGDSPVLDILFHEQNGLANLRLTDPITPQEPMSNGDAEYRNGKKPVHGLLSPHLRYRNYCTLTQYQDLKGINARGAKVAAILKGKESERSKTQAPKPGKAPVKIETNQTKTVNTTEQTLKNRRAATAHEKSTNDTRGRNRDSNPTVEEMKPPAEALLGGLSKKNKKNKNKKPHKKSQRCNFSAAKADQKDQGPAQQANTKSPTADVPKKNSSRKKKQMDKTMTQAHQNASGSKSGPSKKASSTDSSQKRNPKSFDYENASYIKFLESKKNETKTHKHKK